MEITVEMNLDVTKVNRSYYSLLDCMSDIGGILQVLLSGFSFCLLVFNYQHMENFLAASLFKIERAESSVDEAIFNNKKLAHSDLIVPPKYSNIKDFFMNMLPKKLKCCCRENKMSRNQRALHKARDALQSEMNVLSLIQRLRYFDLSIEDLLDKTRRDELKEKSTFVYINPDQEGEAGPSASNKAIEDSC